MVCKDMLMLSVTYAQCHISAFNVQCRYAEFQYVECRNYNKQLATFKSSLVLKSYLQRTQTKLKPESNTQK
jgi:hypothetical protein